MSKASAAVIAAFRNANDPDLRKQLGNLAVEWEWKHQSSRLKTVILDDYCKLVPDVLCSLSPSLFGETPPHDILALCTLVRMAAPKRVFEFGTFTGRTTLNLALNSPPDSKIFTLDLSDEERLGLGEQRWENTFPQSMIGEKYRVSEHAHRITQLLGDSTKFDTSPYAHSMDFIFIDGCHDYEFVKSDTGKALEMLAPGGTIAWHDYVPDFSGVYCHLEDMARTHALRWIADTSVAFYTARAGQ